MWLGSPVWFCCSLGQREIKLRRNQGPTAGGVSSENIGSSTPPRKVRCQLVNYRRAAMNARLQTRARFPRTSRMVPLRGGSALRELRPGAFIPRPCAPSFALHESARKRTQPAGHRPSASRRWRALPVPEDAHLPICRYVEWGMPCAHHNGGWLLRDNPIQWGFRTARAARGRPHLHALELLGSGILADRVTLPAGGGARREPNCAACGRAYSAQPNSASGHWRVVATRRAPRADAASTRLVRATARPRSVWRVALSTCTTA